ncbi:MAG TPA: outer membrane protein transport protein [bacterium]|nr:outer membrane protein transport protein [bacterium]
MKRKKIIEVVVLSVIFALTLCQSAWASGLTLYEQGQPSIGTANVGQAAYANDASTVYFNPAGMTFMERSEVLFGSELLIPKIEFTSDSNIQYPFSGNDGGDNAGIVLPGGGFYFVQKLFDHRLALGLAVNAPAGAGLNYADNWKGRYLVQDVLLLVLNINPSLAVRLARWLHVGAGLSVYYAKYKEDIAIFNPPDVDVNPGGIVPRPGEIPPFEIIPPSLDVSPRGDGQVKLDFDDWRVGYNLGILVTPKKGTRVGLAYRSRAKFKLKGDIDINGLSSFYTERGVKDTYGETEIIIARSIIVSAYQELGKKWAMLFDVGWQDWSEMNKSTITTASGRAVTLNRDWNDTYRLGLGFHYRPVKRLLLKTGFSYDSSPSSLANRTPDLPVAQQWRWAAGFDFDLNESMIVSLNWEFIDLGSARMDKTIPGVTVDPPGPIFGATTVFPGRRFAGAYDQYINVVAASFRWKFGKPEKEKPQVATPLPASLAKVG